MTPKSDITMPPKRGGNQSTAHSVLVNACLLELSGIPGVTVFRTNSSAGGIVHQRGLPPGWPDITMLIGRGRVAFVECKTGKAKPSEEQLQFARKCTARGVPVLYVHNIEELRAKLAPKKMGNWVETVEHAQSQDISGRWEETMRRGSP